MPRRENPSRDDKETGYPKESNEDTRKIKKVGKVRVEILELTYLDMIESLSLLRLLISQRISHYTKYTEHIELWNLSVLVNQPLSDTEIKDRINDSIMTSWVTTESIVLWSSSKLHRESHKLLRARALVFLN